MNNGGLFISFLDGINRSLGIASKVLPILEDSKPLFNNARNIYNRMNNIDKPKQTKRTIKIDNDSPKFFI